LGVLPTLRVFCILKKGNIRYDTVYGMKKVRKYSMYVLYIAYV
jgi:hypothetical protein